MPLHPVAKQAKNVEPRLLLRGKRSDQVGGVLPILMLRRIRMVAGGADAQKKGILEDRSLGV